MARFLLAPLFECLLVWTMALAPATGNAAVDEAEMIIKEWQIPPEFISLTAADLAKTVADENESGGRLDQAAARRWLMANGIKFEGAAGATYALKSSRLIVRNTPKQLDRIDRILKHALGTPHVWIEIECRLLQVERKETKKLNFDEVVKALNSPAKMSSQSVLQDASGRPAFSPDVLESFLSGSSNSPTPLAGVFTDPQFQLLLRALAQKKGAELLTSPLILVKSGSAAEIRFVRQYSNPVDDIPPQVRSLVPAADAQLAAGVKKSSVPLRDGNRAVTLKVEPVIGPDGYTIDLGLTPQVTESDDFVSCLGPFQWMDPAFGQAARIVTPQFVPTPIFSTRKVTTTVSVYDCSTVALSDLLRPGVDGPPEKYCLILCISASLHNASSVPVGADEEKERVIEDFIGPPIPSKELPLMTR